MKKFSLIVCTLVMMVSVTSAGELSEGENFTSVKLGMIGSGTVDIDGVDVDHSTGYSIGLGYDFPLGERGHYGISIDLHRMKWSGETERFDGQDAETLLDLGLTWKYMLIMSEDRFAVRPGVGIGFGTLRRRQALSGTNYLTLKMNLEIIYASPWGMGLLVEAGGFYTPTGGDSETDIKIGPLPFIRAGVLF